MNQASAVEAQWQKQQVTELEVLHAQHSRLSLQFANDPFPAMTSDNSAYQHCERLCWKKKRP